MTKKQEYVCMYSTNQKFVVKKIFLNVFDMSFLCSLHLFDQKYITIVIL